MTIIRSTRYPAVVLAVALLAGACDGSGASDTTLGGVETTTTRAGPTTEAAPTTTVGHEDTTTTSGVVGEAEGSGCTPGPGSLPDGTWFGYVTVADADGIEFDLACWFTGDAATRAAEEEGEESPPPNDYYVRNSNETTRDVPVADGTQVIWYPNFGDPTTEATIDYQLWLTEAEERDFMPGVWIEVSGGEVVEIAEQWVP